MTITTRPRRMVAYANWSNTTRPRRMVAYANWSKEPHLVVPGWTGVWHANYGQVSEPSTSPVLTQGVAGRGVLHDWEPADGLTDLKKWAGLIRRWAFAGDIAHGIDCGVDWGGVHRFDHSVGLLAKALRFNAGFLAMSYDFYIDPFIHSGVATWKTRNEYRWNRLDIIQGMTKVRSVQVIACQQQSSADCYERPTVFSDAILDMIAKEVDTDMDVLIYAGAKTPEARAVVDAGVLKLAERIGG